MVFELSRRSDLCRFAALLWVASLTLALVACREEPSLDRPDIVLVVVDTMRADHLSLHGYERATTPRLDALAAERGLVFDRAFAHSGWTLPSLASLMTGLYPAQHGVARHPTKPMKFGRLVEGTPTLASILNDAGYRTGAIVNNTFLAREFGLHEGFEHYDYFGSSSRQIRSAQETVELGLEFLRASEQPTFLFLHLMEPHMDYDPPERARGQFASPEQQALAEELMDRYRGGPNSQSFPSEEERAALLALYDEEILAVDMAIGELAEGLQQESQTNWLWITGDHGEEFWDHSGFEHGHQLYGELLRVPLVGIGPSEEGRKVNAPVQQIDLFRTIAEIGGAALPNATEGLDLREASSLSVEQREERVLLAEDCLYGPPRVALTRGDRRLLVDLEAKQTYLFELDSNGQADRFIEDPSAEAERRSMMGALLRLRGSLDALEVSSVMNLDQAALERLRSLGYLE